MKDLKYLDKFRIKHPLIEDEKMAMGDSFNGVFELSHNGNRWHMIASNGGSWDHVSITLDKKRTPTWEEMCWVKSIFFEEDEVAIQIHPKKSDHISHHNTCLHLWRSQKGHELPPTGYV